jgi:type IV pilus assembly protein PilC
MDWKRIASFDLGRLLGRSKDPLKNDKDHWIFRLADAILLGRLTWPGPAYWRRSTWRRDLLDVTEQLQAIVRINGPLAEGLDAVAYEEFRLSRGSTLRKIIAAVCFILVVTPQMMVAIGTINKSGSVISLIPSLVVLAVTVTFALPMIVGGGQRRRVFIALRNRVKIGEPLSHAMGQLPRFFPKYYTAMVAAGEKTGQLSNCLNTLSEDALQSILTWRSTRLTMLYLYGVLCIQCSIIGGIVLFVLPTFYEILADFSAEVMDAQAPLLVMVRQLQHALSSPAATPAWNIACAIAFFGAFIIILRHVRSDRRDSRLARRAWGSWLIYLPFIRQMVIQENLAAVARIIEKLLKAGVPLPEALETVQSAGILPAYSRKFKRIHHDVSLGVTLSEAMEKHRSLPPLPKTFRGIIALGERSAMLSEACANVADTYRGEVAKRSRLLTDAIMPIGILALGGLTLFVELMVFQVTTSIVMSLADPIL